MGNKPKVFIFVKPGLDTFVRDVATSLSSSFNVKIIYVTTNLKDIDHYMKAADLCWFEWCDDLMIYGSKTAIAKHKKIICRIHSYEVFTSYLKKVNWKSVDKVVFVSDHIREYALAETPSLVKDQTTVIPNGIKVNELSFKERTKGFNIAYVGYLNFKKGPMLLLHAFHAIYEKDSNYKLFIAGNFQEPRYKLYFNQMIEKFGLQDNVIVEGWQSDINHWLEDKQYILSSSLLESQHLSVMEAMAKGIKPLVHNFVGAGTIYPEEFIWSTFDDLTSMIEKGSYNSLNYRRFVERNYEFSSQITKVHDLLEEKIAQKNIYSIYFNGKQTQFLLPNSTDHIQRIIANHQVFYEESMLMDIKNRVPEDSVIIDVGAYIGNHSTFFAQHCQASVFSIEPNREAFDLLEKNVQLNGLENKTTLLNIGVGKKLGKGSIVGGSEDNMGMSQLKGDFEGDVVIETIDHLFSELKRVDVIKIDVEGMEMDVLQGAEHTLKKHKPLLYIETTTDDKLHLIYSFLEKFNYKSLKQFNATPTTLFV
ncbi:FkbM family methyltransferase [Halobacillus sp. K22]|uniref:FkbM family methyltransferase n=1 Tax=Halobacillus sp. K22 TaxID=3457431 RepID=UPI003FCC835F